MTTLDATTARPSRGGQLPKPRRGSVERAQGRIGYAFVSLYTLLLVAFGVLPSVYAVYLAFTKKGAFVGFDNFAKIFKDYRFLPAVEHVGVFLVVWLVGLVILVVVLALFVHAIGIRWISASMRFLYYIPGALAGASSVMLWLFVLDPTVSPVSFVLQALGITSLVGAVGADHLPVVLAVIAFWTGAGGWIIVMYGALNNISKDVIEAARVDGAGPIRTAWSIQIPLMRKWIAYMVILSFAGGTQLFVEPRVLSQASRGVVTQDYSLNQLAFLYAFKQSDFNGSAAISLVLLVVAVGLSIYFVFRGASLSALDLNPAGAQAAHTSPGQWLGRAFAILLLIVFALFFVVPLVWLVIAPTKTDRQLLLEAPFALGDFGTLASNWQSLVAFQGGLIWTWIGNSAFYCVAALAITLIVSIPAGYALALTEFRGRRALLATTLIVMLVPNTALVLPIFLELSAVKLIGNPLAAILPFSFFPFGVYLTYIYFSTAVSRELLDAARIDGANELQVFARIAMPLATPVIALVGFFNFTGNWNNYFLPYVMLPGRKAPIQVGLAELLSNVPSFNPTNAASTTISLSALALATLIAIAPVMIVFLFAQRYLVSGMTAGATKE